MGSGILDLNEPPEEEILQYVMLQKDKKPICRTKCSSFPFDAPSLWTITEFRPSMIYWKLNWPRCQLYPEHENSHQKREWGIFMHFLWKNKLVAVVKFECRNFYVLAPNEYPEFTHAIVLYRIRNTSLTAVDHKTATPEAIQKPCKTEHLQPINQSSTDVLNPEILAASEERLINCEDSRRHSGKFVDSSVGLDAKKSDTLHTKVSFQNKNDIDDLKVHQPAMDFVPCESVEDAPSSSQPISSTIGAHFGRNFVKTDPTFLQTLSQTHSEWVFGAIAELVDNARDANATRLDIKVESLYSKVAGCRIPVLSIVDDGNGMSHADIVTMLSYGHKTIDGEDHHRIGRFGIGFKTGAMKLGKDALVLTQNSGSRSVGFLSQTYNQNKENLEFPIITYLKQGHYMEVDPTILSEECAKFYLKAIEEISPFNVYFIGEKLGLFGEKRTGTQIYIWNLDKWGSDYSLEWDSEQNAENAPRESQSDIRIRSRRVRPRSGQISVKVPLDYSLHAYLEVIFLNPRMKIYVQGSLVKSRPLARYLNKTIVVKGHVMGKAIQLILGRSQPEWERVNCGMFLYWHGRLIEAYKRVGGMIHNADMGRGVLGVVDVTNIMDDGNGHVGVLHSKQRFQDCESYVKLEEWLGNRTDEYWDENYDKLDLVQKRGCQTLKPDHEWVQCNKCRKWRILVSGYGSESLPPEWFCYMPPFSGKCETPEQQLGRGVITVAAKRSGYEREQNIQREENIPKLVSSNDVARPVRNISATKHEKLKQDAKISVIIDNSSEDGSEEESSETEDHIVRPPLKRLRRGLPRSCKQN